MGWETQHLCTCKKWHVTCLLHNPALNKNGFKQYYIFRRFWQNPTSVPFPLLLLLLIILPYAYDTAPQLQLKLQSVLLQRQTDGTALLIFNTNITKKNGALLKMMLIRRMTITLCFAPSCWAVSKEQACDWMSYGWAWKSTFPTIKGFWRVIAKLCPYLRACLMLFATLSCEMRFVSLLPLAATASQALRGAPSASFYWTVPPVATRGVEPKPAEWETRLCESVRARLCVCVRACVCVCGTNLPERQNDKRHLST